MKLKIIFLNITTMGVLKQSAWSCVMKAFIWGLYKTSFFVCFNYRPSSFSFLCWDHWNNDMKPTLDTALLCSSRAVSDLGHESGLG